MALPLTYNFRNVIVRWRATLATIRAPVKAAGITRTALILVGPALAGAAGADSRLYAADHHHVLRPRRAATEATPTRR